MRIIVHIGVPFCGAGQLQAALDTHREKLLRKGVLFSKSAGRKNHSKLYMAVSDPDRPDPLRLARGYATAAAQDRLRRGLAEDILAEAHRNAEADVMLFSAPQLATLPTRSALERLRALLLPVSDDITILAHVEDQARVLLRHYAEALQEGRRVGLTQEMSLAQAGNWGPQALTTWRDDFPADPALGAQCPEVQAVPHWLDYATLVARWHEVFGPQKVVLRPYDPARFSPDQIDTEVGAILGVKGIGERDPAAGTAVAEKGRRKKAPPVEPTAKEEALPPSAPTLTRWRQINLLLERLSGTGRVIPRTLWRNCLSGAAIQGTPVEAGTLSVVSKLFDKDNTALRKGHPALTASCFKPSRKETDWAEVEPGFGFRATQYVAAVVASIEEATAEAKAAGKTPLDEPAKQVAQGGPVSAAALAPTAIAEGLFSDRARENFHHLKGGRFAPHNRIGNLDETAVAPDYAPIIPRAGLAGNSTGKVIIGCMKNEAPYILEWVAYHRQIGVDHFLIYTNDCSDGTDEILDRLQEMGIVEHRSNNDWKGNSPQQHALNKAMREPVVVNADWLIHIDVDEYINIRIGNGTLNDFFAQVPAATNVAMTWRMFGYSGVTQFEDELVIKQFSQAAPKYCPKPHTNWGFKTMTRNDGVYSKLSCHRPNKIIPEAAPRVQWVNGSGKKMSPGYHEKGWRSDLETIGYDMLQLNHYALRSAESFLIKRQRGRALHVDRSIGLNYWIRMDWSTNQDVTIMRNIPRVEAERAQLLQDSKLRQLHNTGLAWHQAKAAELHGIPEYEELYQQALVTKLTDLERVAFALALDMES